MSFEQDWIASRRLFILRLLVEVGFEANEGVIIKAAERGGFARDTKDTIRRDLDTLVKAGCLTQDWLNSTLRVVKLTERGEEAAYGRVAVAGVECSRWDR